MRFISLPVPKAVLGDIPPTMLVIQGPLNSFIFIPVTESFDHLLLPSLLQFSVRISLMLPYCRVNAAAMATQAYISEDSRPRSAATAGLGGRSRNSN